jgi:hypothetical protein
MRRRRLFPAAALLAFGPEHETIAQREKQPCMFYFHPWEIDPDQPRILGASSRRNCAVIRNLHAMQERLVRRCGISMESGR